MPNEVEAQEQQEGQQQVQETTAAGQGAPAGGRSYPRLEAVLANEEAARGGAAAAAPAQAGQGAPAAKPAAGAGAQAKPASGTPRSGPVVARALQLREREAALAQREKSIQETEAGLASLRELSAKLASGDRIGFLRALAKDDSDFYALITEGATHAAGVREKDPKVAATALPAAVQRELAELRQAVGEIPGLKKQLEDFQGARQQALQSMQLEEQTRKAEAVWADGWKAVEAAAAELPHVVVAGDTADAKEAQEEARQMVEARFLELARAERTKTRAPIPEARAQALVGQAAREVNGRLAKLLKRSPGPGNVGAGRPTAAPRATSTQQPGASAGQGTGRPKVIPTTVGEPGAVDRRNLSESQLKKLAAEGLAKRFPELAG